MVKNIDDYDKLLEAVTKKQNERKKRKAPRPKRRKASTKSGNGYTYIYVGNKQVLKHRYLMEKHLKRKLLPHEAVYFIDGNKENFAIDNLQLGIKPGKHHSIECPHCKKDILK